MPKVDSLFFQSKHIVFPLEATYVIFDRFSTDSIRDQFYQAIKSNNKAYYTLNDQVLLLYRRLNLSFFLSYQKYVQKHDLP